MWNRYIGTNVAREDLPNVSPDYDVKVSVSTRILLHLFECYLSGPPSLSWFIVACHVQERPSDETEVLTALFVISLNTHMAPAYPLSTTNLSEI